MRNKTFKLYNNEVVTLYGRISWRKYDWLIDCLLALCYLPKWEQTLKEKKLKFPIRFRFDADDEYSSH